VFLQQKKRANIMQLFLQPIIEYDCERTLLSAGVSGTFGLTAVLLECGKAAKHATL